MSLPQKVKSVKRLYDSLDRQILNFKTSTGLKCATGCGKCCLKPNVEASVLEFLPFAYHFYHEHGFETVLEFVEGSEDGICHLFKPVVLDSELGFCGNYETRGLICRLFGFSAMKDKNGNPTMFTCKIIKSNAHYSNALQKVNNGLEIPFTANYYKRLAQIDFSLANEILPINKAIRRALQEVVHYYTYRPKSSRRNLPRAG